MAERLRDHVETDVRAAEPRCGRVPGVVKTEVRHAGTLASPAEDCAETVRRVGLLRPAHEDVVALRRRDGITNHGGRVVVEKDDARLAVLGVR